MGHFYFVRHGETVWNVENKICGATDIALTKKGHQQAIETGREFVEQGIARIVESYFHEMTNEEFSAFAVENCAIVRYEF